MAVLSVDDAVKEYESGTTTLRALKGVDVAIDAGDFVAIVGPSGSGKSTLLNLLGLLDVPTEGTVTLRGRDAATLSTRQRTDARRRTIGFVFQRFYLLPTLTAEENVAVPGLLEQSRADALARSRDLLERVGLGDRLHHTPDELSGGQKQRVAIARALVNAPDVVLADEPTGNLDHDTGDTVLEIFEEIADDGVAVVTVTHDDLVADFADRTINLIDGRIEPC